MNLRRITLKYKGWCPGIKSASGFIPDKEIPIAQVYALIIIAALGISVPYLLFFQPTHLPAWIIAEKIEAPIYAIIEEDTSKLVSGIIIFNTFINEQVLSENPKLAMAIRQADSASGPGFDITPPGPWIKMAYDEAKALMSLLRDEHMITGKTHVYKIELKGNWYRIIICFGEPPLLL
jgi:hypothetical protein